MSNGEATAAGVVPQDSNADGSYKEDELGDDDDYEMCPELEESIMRRIYEKEVMEALYTEAAEQLELGNRSNTVLHSDGTCTLLNEECVAALPAMHDAHDKVRAAEESGASREELHQLEDAASFSMMDYTNARLRVTLESEEESHQGFIVPLRSTQYESTSPSTLRTPSFSTLLSSNMPSL